MESTACLKPGDIGITTDKGAGSRYAGNGPKELGEYMVVVIVADSPNKSCWDVRPLLSSGSYMVAKEYVRRFE